jgi:hypothetical protein
LRYGRWNCERANSSVRSLFATTINVLEGLLEYERATRGTTESVAARKSSKEYLLKRYPFRRLTVGEPADEQFLLFVYPNRWRYDVYALSITSVVWRCSLVLTPIHDSEKLSTMFAQDVERMEGGLWNRVFPDELGFR